MCHELEKPFSDGECFLAENNLKGNATARWATIFTFRPQDWPLEMVARKLSKIIWTRNKIIN